jgi:hypothetical protein
MSWSRPVFSGRAQEVSYDDTTQEMTVLWRNGRSTIYFEVPEDAALELSHAPSVGTMINTDFTGKYRHRNV